MGAREQISWASLRAMVDPSEGKRICVKHSDVLKGRAKFVLGEVTLVGATSVKLADGSEIPFDYCILATGAATTLPTTVRVCAQPPSTRVGG